MDLGHKDEALQVLPEALLVDLGRTAELLELLEPPVLLVDAVREDLGHMGFVQADRGLADLLVDLDLADLDLVDVGPERQGRHHQV